MAKVKVLFGQMRGKVGGVVFRHDPDGMTVASEYNPSPSNPRTMSQMRQRGKMNLAGKISAMTPSIAIAGLGANRRAARSAFVSNLLRKTQQNGSSNPQNLIIQPADLKLSKGVEVPMTVTSAFASATNTATITVARIEEGQNLVGAVVVLYVTDSEDFIYCDAKMINTIIDDVPGVATFKIPTDIVTAQGGAHVYVVPIVDETGEVRRVLSENVMADEMNNMAYKGYVGTMLANLNAYGASTYIDMVAFS